MRDRGGRHEGVLGPRRQPVGEWRVILRRTAIRKPRRGCTARSIRAWAEGLWVMVIRIGTWNLENLFKPPNPFAPKTEEEYQAKLDALASALTRMDPHVLAVQEVGDPVALGELADRVGGTWHIDTAAPETGTAHAIRVGVLSRLPLTTFDPVAAFPDKLRAIQQSDKPTDNTTA